MKKIITSTRCHIIALAFCIGITSTMQQVIAQPYNALAFNGTNNYVSVPHSTSINLGNDDPITIQFWIKTTTTTYLPILNKFDPSLNYRGYGIALYANGAIATTKNSGSGNGAQIETVSTNVSNNVWHQVTVIMPDANASNYKIYIDGSLAATKIDLNTLTGTTNNTLPIKIGTDLSSYFNSQLDEIRIWKRTLCSAEIQANYNKGLSTGQNGLVAYYKMDQGIAGGTNTSITTLIDASGNANTGTLSGFALTNGNTTSNFITGTVITTATTPFSETSSNTSKTMSGTTPVIFNTGCSEIATITPAGTAQVTGNVTAIQLMDATVQKYNGVAYIQRHYDISATTNPTTATANVTLYFTQADFDAYNATSGTAADLPTVPTDNVNLGNVRVTQFHGTPTGGFAPDNYPTTWGGSGPAHVVITPGATNVVWKAASNRWEVTFPITGFSGFFVGGVSSIALPIKLLSFTATNAGTRNRIDWNTATEDPGTSFEITRSSNGLTFDKIGTATGKGHDAAYTFYDNQPIIGANYYRLKIIEATGTATFSNIAVVKNNGANGSISIAPIPATNTVTITNTNGDLAGTVAIVYDMQGREMNRLTLAATNQITVAKWAAGIYILRLADGTSVRLVKQ